MPEIPAALVVTLFIAALLCIGAVAISCSSYFEEMLNELFEYHPRSY